MEMPRLKTRTKNKDTRPGVKAGVDKKKRPSPEEKQQALEAQKSADSKDKAARRDALQRLAVVEDEQHKEDLAYTETANHPPDRPSKSSTPKPLATDSAPTAAARGAGGDNPGSGDDDSQAYDPEDSSDSESEADDSEEDAPKSKKKKANRDDVLSKRSTRDSTGTPAVQGAEDNGKKRKSTAKAEKSKKKAKTSKKKSGLNKESKSVGKDREAATRDDDDSMVAPGGPAIDDDSAEVVERPKKGGKKVKGIPSQTSIAIQPVQTKQLTRKELRGGAAKWTLKHLPPGTADEFTNEVVPLCRQLAGTLTPWSGLTVKQIQDIVNQVYGENVHEVTKESAWVGLVGYRLSDWRAAIAAQAIKAIEALIEDSRPAITVTVSDGEEDVELVLVDAFPDDSAEAAEAAAPNADGDSAGAAAPNADGDAAGAVVLDTNGDAAVLDANDDTADTAPRWKLYTAKGMAAFVEWALETRPDIPTSPFHWRTWGDGVDKKGFLQSHLIVYTFAYHLSCLAAIPGGYKRLDAQPVGALLLSVQAVQRALEFWRTGTYVNPLKASSHFSVDNWGDIQAAGNVDKKKNRLVRRATKFLASVQKWDDKRWKEVKEAADEWVELPGRKRGATGSRSASEASDDDPMLSDDEILVLSD
ncbi:hypothetical protein DFH07DRAFT_956294 [Mycena maculata]|uniref:Uncharacterized protein n=1 Tax=Mycena maculata TaxID=230809 RepID=A0AAD7NKA8_9AGAR|nr:hypothetical protein DFH07DRAFT_956294 [Mycena maculata]